MSPLRKVFNAKYGSFGDILYQLTLFKVDSFIKIANSYGGTKERIAI